jgi:lipoprotein-anchoring transpeptidase ErfK/SrfK
MPSNKQLAESAIQNAFFELRRGKRQAARFWAHRAITLAPESEDPWLILAALAKPHVSLQYLKEALRINPDSQRARNGLLDVQKRLERSGKLRLSKVARKGLFGIRRPVKEVVLPAPAQAAHKPLFNGPLPNEDKNQPASPKAEVLGAIGIGLWPANEERLFDPPPPKSGPNRNLRKYLQYAKWLGLITISVLAVVVLITLIIAVAQSSRVDAKVLPTSEQRLIILQPLATASATVTEIPPPTESPTATPLPSETPTPTNTALPTSTDTLEPTSSPSPIPSPTASETAVPELSEPAAPANTYGVKRIVVSISQQHLYAYQGDALVYSFVASTGASNSTRTGTFSILDKIPDAWSDPWGFWMPDWLGLYWVGNIENGIHALPVMPSGYVIWGSGLGTPITHGCVVLNTPDARLLFHWAEVGTQVEIVR